jgi:hypothetical protein
VSASQGTAKSVESSDAVRSVLIASEFISDDDARMRLVDPSKDLAIFDDGRGLSVRVPREVGNDFWYYTWDPVTYRLQAIPGTDSFALVRTDASGSKPLASCLLRDMLVRVVPVGEVSDMQAYLEITLVGVGNASSKAMYTQAQLLPLTLWSPPTKYEVPSH